MNHVLDGLALGAVSVAVLAQTVPSSGSDILTATKEWGLPGACIIFILWFARHMVTVVLPEKDKEFTATLKAIETSHAATAARFTEALETASNKSREDMKEWWAEHRRERDEDRRVTREVLASVQPSVPGHKANPK